jgi:phosphatidylglycerophosphate synthase
MAVALVGCAIRRAAWPVALGALPAFLCLLALGRRAFTPSGRFGFANAVTTLRLALVLALALLPGTCAASRVIALLSVVLVLDLVDGWLARRCGDASAFGAHFDMETDALLVLVVTLRLWLVHGFGVWVLFSGLLRYLHVLGPWLRPGTSREAPRSRFGRYAFVSLMLGLCAGLALPGAIGTSGVCLGTLAVTWSFARSCYFSRVAN